MEAVCKWIHPFYPKWLRTNSWVASPAFLQNGNDLLFAKTAFLHICFNRILQFLLVRNNGASPYGHATDDSYGAFRSILLILGNRLPSGNYGKYHFNPNDKRHPGRMKCIHYYLLGRLLVFAFAFAGMGQVAMAQQHEIQKLLAADGVEGDAFGYSVSVSGEMALIGTRGEGPNGFRHGAAYVFQFDDATQSWLEKQKIVPVGIQWGDDFGDAVAIAGDMAIVAAPFDEGRVIDSGAVYTFRFDEALGYWVEEQKLFASDGSTNDYFGSSLSVFDDVIMRRAKAFGFKPNSLELFRSSSLCSRRYRPYWC